MLIQNNDPALRFLCCYDRYDKPVGVTAIDLSTQIGYWQGEAIPVAYFEFVAPNDEILTALKEYLGRYADHVYLQGTEPGPHEPVRPTGVGFNPNNPISSFVQVGHGDDWKPR